MKLKVRTPVTATKHVGMADWFSDAEILSLIRGLIDNLPLCWGDWQTICHYHCPLHSPLIRLIIHVIKYVPSGGNPDVGYRTTWVHVNGVPQRGFCSPSVGLFASLARSAPMSTEISLSPDRCSMPAGAAPCLSHPCALQPSFSLSSLTIAPASKVRYDILKKKTLKCFRTGNPLPRMMILSLGAPRMCNERRIREGNCASIPTSSSNTSLTVSSRSYRLCCSPIHPGTLANQNLDASNLWRWQKEARTVLNTSE
uniref:Uncharacterized protein n=1 Tax=Arundo donax TaxID=35708 RepID=A0A0A8XZ32_ARUDO